MKEGGTSTPDVRRRGFRHWWPVVALTSFALAFAAVAGLAWWVQAGAHDFGARAMREFSGDEVDALLALVESRSHPLAERNRAVHALGQIGDRRALPVLKTRYTGQHCQHEKFLCQSELRKAIERCSGRNWAPAWLPFFPRPPRR